MTTDRDDIASLLERVETTIDAVMESERYAPKTFPAAGGLPIFDGMQPDNDGAWVSRVDVAKRLRAALAPSASMGRVTDEFLHNTLQLLFGHRNYPPQAVYDLAKAFELAAALDPPSDHGGGEGDRQAWRDVLAERKRQVESEGWTPEHDDAHAKGEMASAAGVYALAAGSYDYRWVLIGRTPNDYLAAALKLWPWEPNWFKPKDRRRDLVKAGALILAEIERLDRASLPAQESEDGR